VDHPAAEGSDNAKIPAVAMVDETGYRRNG
jgi:hypothetical protein